MDTSDTFGVFTGCVHYRRIAAAIHVNLSDEKCKIRRLQNVAMELRYIRGTLPKLRPGQQPWLNAPREARRRSNFVVNKIEHPTKSRWQQN